MKIWSSHSRSVGNTSLFKLLCSYRRKIINNYWTRLSKISWKPAWSRCSLKNNITKYFFSIYVYIAINKEISYLYVWISENGVKKFAPCPSTMWKGTSVFFFSLLVYRRFIALLSVCFCLFCTAWRLPLRVGKSKCIWVIWRKLLTPF